KSLKDTMRTDSMREADLPTLEHQSMHHHFSSTHTNLLSATFPHPPLVALIISFPFLQLRYGSDTCTLLIVSSAVLPYNNIVLFRSIRIMIKSDLLTDRSDCPSFSRSHTHAHTHTSPHPQL
uniref:Uncharacterized protein n=1 Tax=Mastacembelus armatus TaxID=205130 RepID=A0A7N8WQL1_9TELE